MVSASMVFFLSITSICVALKGSISPPYNFSSHGSGNGAVPHPVKLNPLPLEIVSPLTRLDDQKNSEGALLYKFCSMSKQII